MKKKIAGMIVAGIAVFALSGCGGGDDYYYDDPMPPPAPVAVLVDNLTLNLGTRIEIYSYSDGHIYNLDICPNYTYHIDDLTTDSLNWDYGDFINDNPIIDLRSYDVQLPLLSIYTHPESPGELREGFNYDLAVGDGWHGWDRIRVEYIGTPNCP